MTRKDYELIASALESAFSCAEDEKHEEGITIAIDRLTETFLDANPKFDATKFYLACGMTKSKI